MLEVDPEKRVTAEEALKHNFFASLEKDTEPNLNME
jgi:serine/threonine protein kinase